MYKNFLIHALLLLTFTTLYSQDYQWTQSVHPLDKGQITAQTVSADGDVYIAAYKEAITGSFSSFGLNQSFQHGQLVLSRMDGNGNVLWSQTFVNSNARIFDIELDHNEDLIIAGGYYDSLALSPTAQYAGDSTYSGSFMAKFDTSGNLIWSKVIPAIGFTNIVSVAFEIMDTFIIEAGRFYSDDQSLRKLNTFGDTVKTLPLDILVRYITDIEIDVGHNIYLAGGGFSTGYIDTVAIPSPPFNTTYLNYVAKLNANLDGLWVRSTNYITLDQSPQIALFGNQIAFLSNDFPTGSLGPHQFKVKYYNPAGLLLRTDSVSDAFFTNSTGKLGISALPHHLLLTVPVGDTLLQLIRVDTTYQDSLLASIHCRTISNYPKFGYSSDALFFTSSFYTPMAIINMQDTILHAAGSPIQVFGMGFRQMLVKFSRTPCPATQGTDTVNHCGAYISPSGFHTWTTSGTYQDVIPNTQGCDSILSIVLSVTQLDTSVILSSATLSSQALGATYQWIDCGTGLAIPGALSASYTATFNGNFAVAIEQNGCKDTSACKSITLTGKDVPIQPLIKLYPNPTIASFILESALPITSFTVRDILGKECLYKKLSLVSKRISVDVMGIEKGIYMVEVEVNNLKRLLRLVIN